MKDKLAEHLGVVCLQDFLVVLYYLAKNDQGLVTQSKNAVVEFLCREYEQGYPGMPARIWAIFSHIHYYQDYGGTLSRQLDPALDRVVFRYCENPVDSRSVQRVKRGKDELLKFTSHEIAYISELADRFRAQYPVAA